MNNKNRRRSGRVMKGKNQRRQLLIWLAAAMVCASLVFGLRALIGRGSSDNKVMPAGVTDEPVQKAQPMPDTPERTEPSSAPQSNPEPSPVPTVKAGEEKVGLLPILSRKKGETKKIAITIDDCFRAEIVRKIIALAEANGAQLTFFPKGNTIKKNADLWKEIYEKGYEIENHTYTHTSVFKMNDEELKKNIQAANDALNEVLGVNYRMRIFRCPTGKGMKSPRLHRILRELGYEAVASWGLSGTRKAKDTIRLAQPGQILLFHATKEDYARLNVVIPALAQKFELVSVNDLYQKGNNEVTELETQPAFK